MQKPSNWDNIPSKSFSGSNRPAPGAYIFGIVKAEETKTKKDSKDMLVLSLDIIEGDFTRYYRGISDDLQKDLLLKHRRLISEEKSLPYFKGDIKAIEESNSGYVFDFNIASLRGKKVGGMLFEEEYEDRNGNIKIKLSIAFLCSCEKAKSGTLKIPSKKYLYEPTIPTLNNDNNNDDDLPF